MFNEATSPSIKNVKIRLSILKQAIPKLKNRIHNLEQDYLIKPTYLIIRRIGNYVALKNFLFYSIWENSGKINITGITSVDRISEAISEFASLFHIEENEICNITVDNIFASGTFGEIIHLRKLKHKINSLQTKTELYNFVCDFIPEKFPAAYCRCHTRAIGEKSKGTVAVFGSGKYNILGAKCQEDLISIFHELHAVIRTL
jgi:TATA-box binding protein (TBP) (component of TFIID and TFIIIB)